MSTTKSPKTIRDELEEARARSRELLRCTQRVEDSRDVVVNGKAIGLDEVGMGALAGPLVVVAILFDGPKPPTLDEVTDSKKISAKKRERLAPLIVEAATELGIGWTMPADIDAHGMSWSWQNACTMALADIQEKAPLIVDGTKEVVNYTGPQKAVVKGDLKHWQIGAASIVAKVIRDQDMAQLAEYYPGYAWGKNAGYGTKAHMDYIKENGPTPWHRMSFLKNIIDQ